jgi:hypothetical protein
MKNLTDFELHAISGGAITQAISNIEQARHAIEAAENCAIEFGKCTDLLDGAYSDRERFKILANCALTENKCLATAFNLFKF